MVPKNWKLSSLEEIAKVSSGGTPSRQVAEYWGGAIPWVTTAEVHFGTILDSAEKITMEGLNNSSAKLFPVNTILMAMYGQGKTRGQVAKLGIEATTNQACAAILLNDDHDVEYYFQFLMSRYEHIREMSNSGGQENLSGGIVKSIQVPVPPLLEQKKIAQILATWDQVIATTERLLALARSQKKALMQQLLTGKKRLLKKNGGRFTEEWVNTTIESVGEVFSGGTPSRTKDEYFGGEIPWITSGKLNDRFVFSVDEFITESGLKNSSAKAVKNGCILVAMYGATAGKVALNKLTGATINQAILAIEPEDEYNNLFLFYFLELEMLKTLKLVQGGQPNLNAAIIKSVKINLPVLEEQQKIADVLNSADQEIETFQSQLDSLKQEKKALMQALLTGKRRVTLEKEMPC
ncbi:restriction endonuclease subunit S [Iodobacter sp. CM08]|uniref:restriction endonuclease subunit S n=1 Tax=Iodobacter sp. CM08 TaxID=3085902 RepID=UPI0029816EF5|nr:restriction endonuclease subunit S [Iodobacter sp. CM08]MDW5418666.1 restriction endonuclease subunit S [Iodobacter sp. CM08]